MLYDRTLGQAEKAVKVMAPFSKALDPLATEAQVLPHLTPFPNYFH